MPSQALTPAFLETLPSLKPEARGTYYFDTEITGFAVEHRANGRATYYYRYRDAGKRVRLARIGAVDKISLIEARVLASRMKKMVAEGGDPKLEADRFRTFRRLPNSRPSITCRMPKLASAAGLRMTAYCAIISCLFLALIGSAGSAARTSSCCTTA